MSEVDDQIARASELIDRTRSNSRGASTRSRKRREAEVTRRIARIAIVDATIIVAAVVIGWFIPLGMFGALAVMALLIAATVVLAMAPVTPEVRAETLPSVPLRALPLQTEAWLDRQRPALPAPAQTLVDAIGVRLDTLAPQLTALDDGAPVAVEVRKLIGEQLPELVKGYARVPEPLRRVPRNGRTPDEQLVDGLKLIETEIGEMTTSLAQGDLDQFATRERFLQIKYRDDEVSG
ncbi:hypothetical protein M9980_08755 [Sphingomonas donggukensis]|uniref:Uncharacterized protein n=1 Tax=Sphingomonas donggukensis TaxID=2949093 RepID=A0ABY4TQJ6_9SPHN|nr:hypothetical protein [Sphingomonas donggukensis]URW74666.1 hypothetical protein M9980_08755 [Sphingomonas donggukensis]